MESTEFFCRTFLPHWFNGPMTAQRSANFAAMDDDTIPFSYTCCYRGFGKSTSLLGWIIRNTCFRLQPFTMLVGKTGEYAESLTENVKTELLGNPYIKEIFGSFKPVTYNGSNPVFSKTSWFVADPETGEPFAFFAPKGAKKQVRGSLIRVQDRLYRPTLIALDDFEDEHDVLNEDLRAKLLDWLEGSLFPCVEDKRPSAKTGRWPKSQSNNINRPPWRIWYQDTVKHHDSVMARIQQSDDWEGHTFPQSELRSDGTYHTCVPEIITSAQVRQEVKRAKNAGKLDRYAMEKMCIPQASETMCWTRDMFSYYRERDLSLSRTPDIDRFIVVDPAKTSKQSAAFTAILGVASDCNSGNIYLRKLVNKRLEPSEILDETFAMAVLLNTRVICVEVTGLEEHIKHLYKSAATSRDLDVEFVWLNARSIPKAGDFGTGREAIKRARGAAILPYYQADCIKHEETLRDSALEKQQLSFPLCARWDALDCTGYIPQILERGGRYFMPKEMESARPDFLDADDYHEFGRKIKKLDWAVLA